LATTTRKPRKKRGNRKGYTTGACSAAAARAAALGLVTGQVPETVETRLPNGQRVVFQVVDGRVAGDSAHAVVIKDAGDDPDVTDKARITADVTALQENVGEIQLQGGEGVGTVTRPGLGLEVGGPAINPVPRRNIQENLREAAAVLLQRNGLRVVISVPGGEQLARRTLNPRLGILGGISILGTTGIVHPWSTAAFRASVVQGIEVAARQGQNTVVLTTGGRTEKFVMGQLPDLDPACFVQMGDFLKPALDTVVATGIPHVIIGGMVGKLTKMAQGETITHAGRNPVDTALLAELAAQVGAPAELCEQIRGGDTARLAGELLAPFGLQLPFLRAIAGRVIEALQARYPGAFRLRVLVCDFEGNYLTEVADRETP